MEYEGMGYCEWGSGARQRGYIYDGGWVILKCSANHHLCIFGLGLGGLWVLWAARQRWNRKEKCSWKRMRRLRAPDLWNSSLQMKCTLPSGLFFPSLFRNSRVKKINKLKKSLLIYPQMCHQRYTSVVPVGDEPVDCIYISIIWLHGNISIRRDSYNIQLVLLYWQKYKNSQWKPMLE